MIKTYFIYKRPPIISVMSFSYHYSKLTWMSKKMWNIRAPLWTLFENLKRKKWKKRAYVYIMTTVHAWIRLFKHICHWHHEENYYTYTSSSHTSIYNPQVVFRHWLMEKNCFFTLQWWNVTWPLYKLWCTYSITHIKIKILHT